jgi:type I restriction enzyme S subunit
MMASLRRARMEEICILVTDGTHDSPKLQKEGVPFIKGKNISGGAVDFSACDFITPEDHAEACRRVKPQRGDILFSNIGSVGDTAVVRDDREFSIKNVALFRPDRRKVDQSYFYYLVLSPEFRANVMNVRSGSAQPFITLGNLRSFEVGYVEDIAVQQRIASILSAYDELIENNQRRIRILEDMARSLYREWFIHFRYPGHESVPLVASPLGPIPQGWEVKKLGEIAENMRRNVPKGQLDEPQPYVGLEHIPRRSLALDAWETATDLGSNKLAFKKGEILFGKIRPYFHKVSVAPFAGLCSADTIVIRARSPEHYAIVVACVSSDAFVAHATATSNGSKMPRANWHVLKEYQVAIPTGKLAARFSSLVCDAVAQQQALVFQTHNLRRTRDLLLPRLLSGQVALSTDTSPATA